MATKPISLAIFTKPISDTVLTDKNKIEKKHTKFLKFCYGVGDFLIMFMNTSSIHGLRYLVCPSLHSVERIIWLAYIVLAAWGATTLSLSTWTRFQENPTVVSMEHNYKDWNTSFPSVTICPKPKYDEMNLEEIIKKEFPGIKDMDTAIEFIKELSNATYGRFGDVKTKTEEIKPSTYWRVLWKTIYPFVYNLSNSNAESYDPSEMNKVMTEVGVCYSYNSVTTIYNDPKIWATNQWKYIKGLRIFEGSPLDGDIFAQVMNMNSAYGIYILDSGEFPDVSIPQLRGSNSSYKTFELTALSIVSTEGVESLSVQQRKCRLPHESNLLTSPAYSYNLCRMECRMKECQRLCRCVPHFYRPTDNYPVCDLKGMQCLDKYSERLIRMIDPDTGHKVPCKCLQLCNEVNYIVDTDNTMSWTLGSTLKWGLIKYPKFRLKRDILFGQTDLLVAIGGTAGLFLGCSLLSFAEIIYFFTLRLLWFVVRRNTIRN